MNFSIWQPNFTKAPLAWESCWLDHPNWSVFHTPLARGLCAGCWRCHLFSNLGWQEALIYGTQEPFFQVPHLVLPRCTARWTCTALTVKWTDKKSLVPACLPEWNHFMMVREEPKSTMGKLTLNSYYLPCLVPLFLHCIHMIFTDNCVTCICTFVPPFSLKDPQAK